MKTEVVVERSFIREWWWNCDLSSFTARARVTEHAKLRDVRDDIGMAMQRLQGEMTTAPPRTRELHVQRMGLLRQKLHELQLELRARREQGQGTPKKASQREREDKRRGVLLGIRALAAQDPGVALERLIDWLLRDDGREPVDAEGPTP